MKNENNIAKKIRDSILNLVKNEVKSEAKHIGLKVCANCKYTKIDKKGHRRCTNNSDKMPYEDGAVMLYVHPNFSCNQFEGDE